LKSIKSGLCLRQEKECGGLLRRAPDVVADVWTWDGHTTLIGKAGHSVVVGVMAIRNAFMDGLKRVVFANRVQLTSMAIMLILKLFESLWCDVGLMPN